MKATGRGRKTGLSVERRFTAESEDPYADVEWSTRTSRITNPDGTVVFEMADAEVPADWSQVASDIMVSKYFRKAGVPQHDESGNPMLDEAGKPVLGPERSARQVIGRLTGGWRHWGESSGYFATASDAKAFEDELAYMLVHQMAAPNSPQWFNTGLAWAYGITGPAQGHYFVDPADGQVKASDDAYTRPQPHACFIQSANDSLVEPGGLMDLWVREARIFKYGSGTGTNFSAVRGEGEPLSGGGTSSGLMSFLRVGDRAAGAIKSGGTTRRAAKMVIVDVDHPDVEKFINWKVDEEKKVAALIAAGYPSDFNGEAYATVSGQNSNNSVRVSEAFLEAVDRDEDWHLRWRTDPSHVSKTVKARDLWRQIAEAAWQCADPGLQFDTTINDWHTCPEAGRINASNPCSEYMFLDNTACNLASLNLLKFLDAETGQFDVDAFRHAVRLWTIVLEISVLMAQFPSEEIARLSYDYRTLGLGYANLGTVLMLLGMPYDSDQARAYAGALTALMTGESYAASAELASHLGPFPGFAANREHMLRVIRNHRRAAYDAAPSEYEQLSVLPMPISADHVPASLLGAARDAWDRALAAGERYGYRNAQTTLLAPTGTIGLLMDCDTTGVEPDFALVKFKKLAGGGYFKIANQSIEPALRNLGYSADERQAILEYVLGTMTLDGAPHINRDSLRERGFVDEDIDKIEAALPGVFELGFAFNIWALGEEALQRAGISAADASRPGFDLLRALGFSQREIDEANADHLRLDDGRGRAVPARGASPGLRLRQQVREDGDALHPPHGSHPDDERRAELPLRRHLQDDQYAERGDRRGRARCLRAELASRHQGDGALPRRFEAEPATVGEERFRDLRGSGIGQGERDRASHRAGDRRGGDRSTRSRSRRVGAGADGCGGEEPGGGRGCGTTGSPPAAGTAQRLHPGGSRRRKQGLPAHRRVRGWLDRRDLHRHAQGGRGLPLDDQLLRDRHLQGSAVRGAAGGVRRDVHLHPIRAAGDGLRSPEHQDGDVDHRLRLPRAGTRVPRAHRSDPGAA